MDITLTNTGLRRIGIILTTLATAAIHLILLNFSMHDSSGKIDILFTLNGIGFLALLAAYYLPIPIAQNYHNLVRWAFMIYTLATILAWVVMGEKSLPHDWLGYVTKIIEVILLALLWTDKDRN